MPYKMKENKKPSEQDNTINQVADDLQCLTENKIYTT